MADPNLVFTFDTKEIDAAFTRAATQLGPEKVGRAWRRFVREETGKLKRSLSILISREGPIGVMRWWRKRVAWSVRGNGVDTVGRVFHDNVPYKDVIESGRTPSRTPPPPQELIPWMRKKRMLPSAGTLTAKQESFYARRLAVFIGRRGTFQPGDPNLGSSPGPGMQQYARTMEAEREGIVRRGLDLMLSLTSDAFRKV